MTTQPYPLLSAADLADLPQPSWLVDGLLVERALNVLYGPSGGGKSFLALDWALCVAAGLPWLGRATTGGWVVYVAAEGASGLHRRVDAWQQARGQKEPPDRVRFLPAAVNLLDLEQVQRAHATLATLTTAPSLVVVDTMARSMAGGDENSARDVGLVIQALDRIRADTPAAILLVHHTGKDNGDERGSSALRGAADLMAALKPDGATTRLTCSKSKDSEPFTPWTLRLEPTADSCVLRPADRPEPPTGIERLREYVAQHPGDPVATIATAVGRRKQDVTRELHSLETAHVLTRRQNRHPNGRRYDGWYLAADAPTLAFPDAGNAGNAGNASNGGSVPAPGAPVGGTPGTSHPAPVPAPGTPPEHPA